MNRSAFSIFILVMTLTVSCSQDIDSHVAPSGVPGIDDSEIRIGTSLALSGHASYLGTQMLHGAMAYLNEINAQSGIYGRRITLKIYDDQYDPPKCVANTQKLLVEDRVFALFNYVGTPTTVKILPLVKEAQIPLVGMFTGANALRDPPSRYLFNVRASYYQETAAAVQYLVSQLGLEKIAVFYQYDAYGFDGLRGTELALKSYGLIPVAKGTYIRGTLNIEEGLNRIMDAKAEAVVMIGTYDPCAAFIRQAKGSGYHPVFYNVSFVGADELARKLGPDGEGVIVSQVVPPPETENRLWGAGEYASLLKRYYPEDTPNFVGLEGYLNARVLHEGLWRAGRHPTRDRFIDALESIQNFDLGIDNLLSFSRDDHQGLDRVYFTRLEKGRFVMMKTAQPTGATLKAEANNWSD